MTPIDVKISLYNGFHIENNGKDPKFEVSNHVKISKYKIIFVKVTLEIGL